MVFLESGRRYAADHSLEIPMSVPSPVPQRLPKALYALTAGAFGIGTTEFVIMGLLLQVAADLHVSITAAGLLITGYALGVAVGAPLLTAATGRLPRKTALLMLMAVFTVGNLGCALAPDYGWLMAARIVTSLAHGTFFGIGSVVATRLVPAERQASAISIMFTGLTVATLLGVPAGAWLGLHFGWRATFWAVTAIGVVAFAVVAAWVPADVGRDEAPSSFRSELSVLARPQVLLALLATVFGFGGVFAVYTYIQPILTQITGFGEDAVSPILLVFGVGMIVGNLVGGRLADRRLLPATVGTLVALMAVMGAMSFALDSRLGVIVFVGLLGFAAFATVSPLQMRVLQKADGQGRNLASSLNIAAFNLGNAIGAWLGGVTIANGPGLGAVTWAGALLTLLSLAVVGAGLLLERRAARRRAPSAASPAYL